MCFFPPLVGHLTFTLRRTHTLWKPALSTTPKKTKRKKIPEWTTHTPDVSAQLVRQIFYTKSSVKAHQPPCWWPVLCLYATWCLLSFPKQSFLFYQCLISLTKVIAVVGGRGILGAYCSISRLPGL